MNYLILDTNIWIYLANGYVNPKVHGGRVPAGYILQENNTEGW